VGLDTHLDASTQLVPIGFSQGGLMATELLRTRPDRVAATVVLGGFVQGAERRTDAVLTQTRPPVFWGRGSIDTVITASAVARAEAWLPHHSTLTRRIYPGLAHAINADEAADVREFVHQIVGP
jgi:phospholipase/carboxylesterase